MKETIAVVSPEASCVHIFESRVDDDNVCIERDELDSLIVKLLNVPNYSPSPEARVMIGELVKVADHGGR